MSLRKPRRLKNASSIVWIKHFLAIILLGACDETYHLDMLRYKGWPRKAFQKVDDLQRHLSIFNQQHISQGANRNPANRKSWIWGGLTNKQIVLSGDSSADIRAKDTVRRRAWIGNVFGEASKRNIRWNFRRTCVRNHLWTSGKCKH
jgi:hypothetical protein